MSDLKSAKTPETETATHALADAIAAKPTAELVAVARAMNLKCDNDSIIVGCFVNRELETRLTENHFLALMNELEAELIAEWNK